MIIRHYTDGNGTITAMYREEPLFFVAVKEKENRMTSTVQEMLDVIDDIHHIESPAPSAQMYAQTRAIAEVARQLARIADALEKPAREREPRSLNTKLTCELPENRDEDHVCNTTCPYTAICREYVPF